MKKRGRPAGTGTVSPENVTLGGTIRRARLNKNLGLSVVAKKLGVTVAFISSMEQGKAPLPWKLLRKTAKALELNEQVLAMANLEASDTYKKFLKYISISANNGN